MAQWQAGPVATIPRCSYPELFGPERVVRDVVPADEHGFVGSLLRFVGLDWAVAVCLTLSHRQGILNVNLPYCVGTGPLNLLIDSTCIKAGGSLHI